MPLRDTNCPACGDPILRTHHCRASRALDPPTPLNRAEFDRIREQARLEQLAGKATLDVSVYQLPLLIDPDLTIIVASSARRARKAYDATQNRGGRP